MLLKDKVAIVTGAGQGIGRGIANVLAREGARVVIGDLNIERGKAAADLIKSRGGEAKAYQVTERYGVIWIYMGDRAVAPPFPDFELNCVVSLAYMLKNVGTMHANNGIDL